MIKQYYLRAYFKVVGRKFNPGVIQPMNSKKALNQDLDAYYESFGFKFDKDGKLKTKGRARHALQWALDTRKFEIEMYWKRAGYFWTLIGVAFAGYFAILSNEGVNFDRFLYAYIVACIGLVFSFA